MPRRCPTTPLLAALLAAQDQVLSADQALQAGLTRRAIHYRLAHQGWEPLLPQVYLTHAGEPSRRQRLIAALLYTGPDSAIDADDACVFHGVRAIQADDRLVHVVVPAHHRARSRGYVVVRRQTAPISVVRTERLRYVDAATAVIAAARRRANDRSVLAIISDAVQRHVTSYDELLRAHLIATARNAGPTDSALAHIRAGVRSSAEADFRVLAEASSVLPPLLYNCVLQLPGGQQLRPDALAVDAGLVHETNGEVAHRRDDLFEDMQRRHDVMTAAGLTVMHNPPRRIRQHGRQVINEFEACYLRYRGRGLPPGVRLLRSAA